jgi:hypothetical protein
VQWKPVEGGASSTHVFPAMLVMHDDVAAAVHALMLTHVGLKPPLDTQPVPQAHDQPLSVAVHLPPVPHGLLIVVQVVGTSALAPVGRRRIVKSPTATASPTTLRPIHEAYFFSASSSM